MVAPRRFDVFLVPLDPARGAEMQKTRPCVVVSPDVSNRILRTVVVVPLTSSRQGFPGRLTLMFQNTQGEFATDQLRAVDTSRLLRKVGAVQAADRARITAALTEFFA
ncbi:MAG TPA: type II toxin-antitoxin system PemK/MazF family toxin [Rhizomicrobium sp.]|nr:type II toxin-antitoxin system PemK/MazF family toxin [Rhizomicrobium sp.]